MSIFLQSRLLSGLLFVVLNCPAFTWPEDYLDNEAVPLDQPGQLKAISLLQSLKYLKSEAQLQAPYVHELNNHYHVRSLFVESKALPIIDIQLTFNAGSARDEEVQKGL